MTQPDSSSNSKPEQTHKKAKLSFLHVIASTIGAAFGVRNSEAHEEDFAKAKPSTYIIAGLLFTVIFVVVVALVVKAVLSAAGV